MTDLLLGADLWTSTLRGGAALLFVALGVYLPYRAGALNLGAEGIMLAGCYGAILVAAKTGGSPWVGVLAGMATGAALAGLLALLALGLRANLYVIGIALNFAVSGGTAVLTGILYGTAGTITTPSLSPLPHVGAHWDQGLPWLGQLLGSQTVLVYVAIGAAVATTWWINNWRSGVVLRATGTRPDVVQAQGFDVRRTQAIALIVGGALIGLGGAQLALSGTAQFTPDMTSGRGFVALTLIFVAGSRCGLLIPLAFAFAAFDAVGVNLQALHLPTELSAVVPYAAVIVLLVLVARGQELLRRRRPAATPTAGGPDEPPQPPQPSLTADLSISSQEADRL
ncbi:ABC transporter permease [Nocardioides humi]|uniref:ABC transporter permease n=1 Tax=Nocardioides humi TaxID=449461 RepID=A0ABN2BH38_9ACTN|nr:ABC transporter permease [Nocardioides humi]